MTAPRPNFIDLRSQSQTSLSRPLKSPRLHVAGDVPPELSPLDAFALQSRMLAKQLEESAKADKRVSRLPPLTTSSPLVMQGRSEYFRSLSYDSYSDNDNGESSNNLNQPQSSVSSQPITPTGFGSTPEVAEPAVRPRSMHPRMSRIPATPDEEADPPPVPAYARERERLMRSRTDFSECEEEEGEPSLFGARRERSPSPLVDEEPETQRQDQQEETSSSAVGSEATPDATVAQQPPQQTLQPRSEPQRAASSQDLRLRQFTPEPSQPAQPKTKHNLPPLQQTLPYHQMPTSQPSPYTPSGLNPFTQSPEKYPASKNSYDPSFGGLAPPRPLFPKRSSSILSSSLETTDEDGPGVMSSSFHSLGAPRKLSGGSGMSGMVSPGFGSFHRSPSFGSDMSAPLPRPSFNFSRPLSRVGTPGLESPARQASSDSHTSYSQSSLVLADDSANTPVSMHSEGFPDPSASAAGADGTQGGSSSYIYSKFTLPRGKMLQRSSSQYPDNMPPPSTLFEQAIAPPNSMHTLPLGGQAPPSPPTRPSSSGGGSFARPSLERTKLSIEVLAPTSQPSPNPSRPSTENGRSFEETRGRTLVSNTHEPPSRGRTPMSVTTTNTGGTTDSNSTLKPRSMHSLASAAEIPAEEHVDKAIALHEQGQLNESTYHLRHAARQGHPTGMLLYALACRHGWGMRANPREGAEWLRKAADCASIEIADDEALMKEGKSVNALERKTRKAQFALSIYELGVSYMNGWGIEQDKALALRCFEIAGAWGDVDALAEAGFCYAQGIGCKKNLKKSSKFYRQAEAKGMSMVGNSWIHKSKYNDDKESVKSPKLSKDDKTRSKSRSRNIFGIKHSS
ncbi:hypothetical protein SEUCBS139899_005245 [Sporothrix eucalyptigena]